MIMGKVRRPSQGSLARNRDFRRLWVSETLSLFGSGATNLAYPLLVLAVTGSGIWAGAVATVAAAVGVGTQLPAGVIADRYERRRLMIGCQLSMVAVMTAVALAVWNGTAELPLVFVAAAANAGVGTVYETAEGAALRHIVRSDQLTTALSLNSARGHAASLAGPPAGGALFAVTRWLPFGLDALSYLISAGAIALIRKPLQAARIESAERSNWLRDVRAGIRVVLDQPLLRTVAVVAPLGNFAVTAVMFAVVLILQHRGAPPALIGGAQAAVGAGALLGAFLTPLFRRLVADRTIILVECWMVTAAVAAMAILSGSYAVIIPLAVGIVLVPATNATLFAHQMAVTPDHLQGRVYSALMVGTTAIVPLAPLAAGLAFAFVGGAGTITVFAGLVAVTAVLISVSPGIRGLQSLD